MVGGSFQVLWLLPPLKTGRHNIVESGVKHQKSNQIILEYEKKIYVCKKLCVQHHRQRIQLYVVLTKSFSFKYSTFKQLKQFKLNLVEIVHCPFKFLFRQHLPPPRMSTITQKLKFLLFVVFSIRFLWSFLVNLCQFKSKWNLFW